MRRWPTGIINGRIPLYNIFPDRPPWSWLTAAPLPITSPPLPGVLYSYSYHYVVGAYLLRTHGGVELLRDLMYEDYDGAGDEWDLSWATRNSYGYQRENIYAGMFAAVLISNETDVDERFRFNNGGWFEDEFNGITYRYGSINFYNYGDGSGPFTYSPAQFDGLSSIPVKATLAIDYGRRQAGLATVNVNPNGESLVGAALVLRDAD